MSDNPDLLHQEIARLHGVNDRLRAEMLRLRAMAFRPVTLTDAERDAIETAALEAEAHCHRERAQTLRGLLERTETGET